MKRNSSTATIALALIVVAVVACSAVSDGKPAAEKAITEFHSMLDQERYAEICDGLDPQFKKMTSQDEMTKILTAVHTKLGNVRTSKNQTWRANQQNLTTYIEMVQDTEFEQGKGTEDFVFIFADKKVTLAGYHINSNDMLTK